MFTKIHEYVGTHNDRNDEQYLDAKLVKNDKIFILPSFGQKSERKLAK